MVSFFRRKKPDDASAQDGNTRRYSVEELAAAFPDARPAAPQAADPAAATEQARQTVAPEAAPAPQTPDTQTFAPADGGQPDVVVPGPSPQRAEPAPVPATPVAAAPQPAPVAPAPVAPLPPAVVAPVVAAPVQVPAPAPVVSPELTPPLNFTTTEKPAAPAGKTGWRERLRGSVFARSFGGLFSRNPKLDDDLLDEIETALITADVGVGATTALVESLRKRMKAREFTDAQALLQALRADLIAILQPVAVPLVIDRNAKPFVVLTVGVNGVGKTTTIGKLAKRFKDDGHSLMLAAGDTFRAAAVAQLQAWGERNGVAVVSQGQNADAASVAFDALQAGKARGTEVLIADTAGRLHTQTGLMNELGKIRRVLGKIDATALMESLRKRMKAREFTDAQALLQALRADLIAILQPVAVPLVIDRNAKPFVVLTVGVNGVGKTTTIGKLAKRFKDDGHSLMLAAGDTFRAAAVAQLQAWGERNGVAVVSQGQNADAASVAFDALQAGKARGTEVLIADTAGRLHTQTGLMNELGKIRRVLGKIDATAPHEVLMVIDGTTGQNALSQLRQFHAAVGVTGLVVTKLDGTAKGGVVFALAREFGIPIRYAGIGERPEDLRVFDAEAFVDALLPEALGVSGEK